MDGGAEPMDPDAIPDDRLRLIFTCCHPGLPADSRVALTLRLVGGLSTGEIARAFLVSEPTIAQRLVRAKRAIRDRRLPYELPQGEDRPATLPAVLAVVYLIFNRVMRPIRARPSCATTSAGRRFASVRSCSS